jgi:excisionase family DNA binding protein
MYDMNVLGDLGDNKNMNTTINRSVKGTHLVDPPQDLEEMLNLARFLETHSSEAMLLGPDGQQIPLPREAYDVLRRVVEAMEHGASVIIEPIDRQLTTQQAADLLGVSRNTLVRLLDENELPFERLGQSRHRRLRLRDVLAYRDRKHVDRRGRLDELTRQGSEDGLYEIDASTYGEALAEARRA